MLGRRIGSNYMDNLLFQTAQLMLLLFYITLYFHRFTWNVNLITDRVMHRDTEAAYLPAQSGTLSFQHTAIFPP